MSIVIFIDITAPTIDMNFDHPLICLMTNARAAFSKIALLRTQLAPFSYQANDAFTHNLQVLHAWLSEGTSVSRDL
jgi:hypothetical protein